MFFVYLEVFFIEEHGLADELHKGAFSGLG